MALLPNEITQHYINEPVDSAGRTPLYYAKLENIALLIKHGANIDHRDKINNENVIDYYITQGALKKVANILAISEEETLRKAISKTTLTKIVELGKRIFTFLTNEEDKKLCKEYMGPIFEHSKPNVSYSFLHTLPEIRGLIALGIPYSEKYVKDPKTNLIATFVKKTQLHYAQSEENIDELLAKGYDVNATDIFGNTPLSHHLQQGRAHIVKALLAAGADSAKKNNGDKIPVEIAISTHQNELIPNLLTSAALEFVSQKQRRYIPSWDTFSKQFYSLLEYAALHNNTQAMQLLLKRGIDGDKVEQALFICLENKNRAGVDLLLQQNFDCNAVDKKTVNTLLMTAIENLPDVVPLFLAREDLDIMRENYNCNTALSFCIEVERLSLFKQISKYAGINSVNSFGQTPLMLCVEENFLEGIEFLLKEKADVRLCDDRNRTALHYAAKNGFAEIMDILLTHIRRCYPTDEVLTLLKAEDKKGKSPLIYALSYPQMLRKFIKQPGIDLHVRNKKGKNALQIAIEQVKAKSTKLLLGAQCALDHSTVIKVINKELSEEEYFNHVLGSDSASKNFEHCFDNYVKRPMNMINKILRLFVQQGLDIDMVDEDGKTLLITAIENYKTDVVRTLLQLGADAHQVTLQGKQFLTIAQERYRLEDQNYSALKNRPPDENNPYADNKGLWYELELLQQKSKLERAQEIVSLLAPYETT